MEIMTIWDQLDLLAKICKAASDAHKMDQLTIDLLTAENKSLKEDQACKDLKTALNFIQKP